jgi:hypothetical protein
MEVSMKKILVCFVFIFTLILSGIPELQAQPYDNSPYNYVVIPEAVWAAASGGGTWVTALQITSGYASGPGEVLLFFNYGGGSARGPFSIWTNPQNHEQVEFPNILQHLQSIDPSFNYFGRVGSLEILFDSGLKGIAVARTSNGNYSKTFPGLNWKDCNTVAVGRNMAIGYMVNNPTYRSAMGLYNVSMTTLTVNGYVTVGGGWYTGSIITKTLVSYDYQSFNPFVEAGIGGNNYDYVTIEIYGASGTGEVMVFGATTNNTTNDPGAQIAVNWN